MSKLVPGRVFLVYEWGAVGGCLQRAGDDRQRFVLDFYELQGLVGDSFGGGCYQRHRVADVAHFIVTQDRPIHFVDSKLVATGDVARFQHGHHSGQFAGRAGIHPDQSSVWVGAAERPGV